MTTLQQLALRPAARYRDDRPETAFESRTVTRIRGLSDLLARRPELSGVYKPADVATEAIRWSA